MERTCAHHDAALLTIVPVGTMPPSGSVGFAAIAIADTVDALAPAPLVRAERPDSPPPRTQL
jgi:hypothetical protein